MKLSISILLYISIILSGCSSGEAKQSNKHVSIESDTNQVTIETKKKESIDNGKTLEEQEYSNSIKLASILQEALKIADQNIEQNKFVQKYEVNNDSIPVVVSINLDYHFTSIYPHLIIRRNSANDVYINIYSRKNNQFKEVASHKEWVMTYVSDSIQDINGDGLNDFVVNWYGTNGCCLKAYSNVYILKQNKREFAENLEFINPTFSPKERIVRGICYGQPGETEMYKYRWNGEFLDTLEYVSYQKNNRGLKTGKIIISKHESYKGDNKNVKILNSVPKEYRNIAGYDWFTGNL